MRGLGFILLAALIQPAFAQADDRRGLADSLRTEIARCWNVGALSVEARQTAVTLGVELDAQGHVLIPSIRLLDASAAAEATVSEAFQAARRAVIRCGGGGFNLPIDRHADWRELQLTFDPREQLM